MYRVQFVDGSVMQTSSATILASDTFDWVTVDGTIGGVSGRYKINTSNILYIRES